MKPPLILASASARRQALLQQVDIIPAHIIPADIDETPYPDELPHRYVERLAGEKAQTIHALHPDALVLAADTTVACGRRILGKAEHVDEARKFLKLLSGRRHRVYTGVCLIDTQGVTHRRIVMTTVQFKRLHPHELDAYLATEEWQGLAGAYGIQGHAARFVTRINGSYTNVVGLPLYETCALLESYR